MGCEVSISSPPRGFSQSAISVVLRMRGQLMSYLGLVPSEQSSGERIWRGGITKTGNGEARANAHRGRLELSLSTASCQGQGRDRRAASQDSSRHCLEGATSPL
ncbi:transposase [Bradyrhizobium sp. 35]|nr:transposase [Bradyrhizobium sp. 35]